MLLPEQQSKQAQQQQQHQSYIVCIHLKTTSEAHIYNAFGTAITVRQPGDC
jgi:hypothetical protein